MDNAAVITKAFARARSAKDSACRETLRKLMSDAMTLALDLHEDIGSSGIPLHLVVGDDYGWAVLHGGSVVDMDVYTTDDNVGTVRRKLSEAAKSENVDPSVWTGIVMAGMEVMNYNFGHERDILSATARDAAQRVVSTFIRNCRRTRS